MGPHSPGTSWMHAAPLARLDTYLPALVDGRGSGYVQHLSMEALDLDGAGALETGQELDLLLVCREDLRIPLRGTVERVDEAPDPAAGSRARVVLQPLQEQSRADLMALLSSRRKAAHLAIARDEDVEADVARSGLDRYRLPHAALPELAEADLDTSCVLLGRRLRAPLVIAGMTGGSLRGRDVNRRLAAVAQAHGLAMGLGSQRVMSEAPELGGTFQVRDVAPDILLLANVGAVQLNHGMGVDAVRRLVDAVRADALCVHLNPLQEMVQPEGDRDFRGLRDRIATLVQQVGVPVVLKETGAGISFDVARAAQAMGCAAIDVGGLGGTAWGWIEGLRTGDPHHRAVGLTFRNWGIPTAESIGACRSAAPELPLIATGGVRNGLNVAVAIALGARACGVALPFLRAVEVSQDEGHRLAERLVRELRIAMLCSGCPDLAALRAVRMGKAEGT